MPRIRDAIFSIQVAPEHSIKQVASVNSSSSQNQKSQYRNSLSKPLKEIAARYTDKLLLIDFESQGSIRSGFYALLTIFLVAVSSFGILILPQHDILKYPEYWPERIVGRLSFLVVTIFFHHFDYSLIVTNRDVNSKMNLFYLLCSLIISMVSSYLGMNVI